MSGKGKRGKGGKVNQENKSADPKKQDCNFQLEDYQDI